MKPAEPVTRMVFILMMYDECRMIGLRLVALVKLASLIFFV